MISAAVKRCLHIHGHILRLRFLTNLGLLVCLLPRTYFKSERACGPLTPSVANVSFNSTYGTHTIALDLALIKQLKWKFIVVNVSNPIIGLNFLPHYGLAVDLQRRQLLDADHIHRAASAVLLT